MTDTGLLSDIMAMPVYIVTIEIYRGLYPTSTRLWLLQLHARLADDWLESSMTSFVQRASASEIQDAFLSLRLIGAVESIFQ